MQNISLQNHKKYKTMNENDKQNSGKYLPMRRMAGK